MKDLVCFDYLDRKKSSALFLIAFLMILAVGSASGASYSDRIAAIVNGDVILESDIKRHKLPLMRNIMNLPLGIIPPGKWPTEKEILDELIVIHLLEQEANRKGVKIDDKQLDASVQSIKERNKLNPEQFSMFLAANGLTIVDYKKILRTQYTLTKLIGTEVLQKVPFSEEDAVVYFKKKGKDAINEEYDKMKQSMSGAPPPMEQKTPEIPTHQEVFTGGKIRLRQLTLKIPNDANQRVAEPVFKKAKEIIDQANTGADFAQLAKKYSQDPSASSGGDLGLMDYKDMVPALQKMVQRMKPGDINPIKMPTGIVIFYLAEAKNRTSKKEPIPEQVRKQYEKQLKEALEKRAQEAKKKQEADVHAEEADADQEKPKIPNGMLTPAEEKEYIKVRRKAIDMVRHEKLQTRMKEWIDEIKKTSSIDVKI